MDRWICVLLVRPILGCLLVADALFVAAADSQAGAWSSGGGEINQDADNPWFIGPASVAYCVEVDADHFHDTEADLRDLVARAIDYWQVEFQHAEKGVFLSGFTMPAFHLETCGDSTPLRFQFGFLTAAERQQITTPRRYVGLAMRTDYDPVTLQGKGFVYIAPDSGPDRPDRPDSIVERWDDRKDVLLGILTHEVGHVFGLGHRGPRSSLMGARFPESLLAGLVDLSEDTTYFSRQRALYQVENVLAFFDLAGYGLPADTWRIRLSTGNLGDLGSYGDWQVEVQSSASASWRVAGKITALTGQWMTVEEHDMWVPPEQTVFDLRGLSNDSSTYQTIGSWRDYEFMGDFLPDGSTRRIPMHLHVTAEGLCATQIGDPSGCALNAHGVHDLPPGP